MNKFLIGLILGVTIAGGVAFYLNSVPNQFENKVSNKESGNMINNAGPLILAPGTKLQEVRAEESKENASATNYDFYDILQGKRASNNNLDKPQETQGTPPPIYLVQVGEFAEESLANDMKARLTLFGVDANIKIEQVDNKPINKVIVGPFDSEDKANQLADRLSDEDISADVIQKK